MAPVAHQGRTSATTRCKRISRLREERGFVLVFGAIFLTVMIAMGGFAVDIGNWYLNVQRLQRAADAAALAGAVYMPGDPTTALQKANAALAGNGVGNDATVSIVQQPNHPAQLKVTITKTIKNYFVSMLGMATSTFSRGAIAEYHPYLPMGSPSNVLAQEPAIGSYFDQWDTKAGTQGHYWLAMGGPISDKQNGDRWSAGSCAATADDCDKTKTAPWGNADYSSTGQEYIIRIAAGTTGTLAIQMFDPAFVDVGTSCTDNQLTGASNFNPNHGTTSEVHLYDTGSTNSACTGDTQFNSAKTAPPTTAQLYTPDLSPGGSQPISISGCTSQTWPGYAGTIKNKLDPASGSYDPAFVGYFRKWVTVCQIYIGSQYPPGDYILRVSNTNDLRYEGYNMFGMRAGMLTSGGTFDSAASVNVSLYAAGRLVIYAKDSSASTTFYVSRLHSGAAGRTLDVQLFDIGDADHSVNLKFLPPSDASTGSGPLTQFNNCKYTPPGSSTFTTMSNCSISGLSKNNGWQGRLTDIRVVLPSDYTCDDASADGCWTRLQLDYGTGGVTDVTSWAVTLDGNPLHLLADGG